MGVVNPALQKVIQILQEHPGKYTFSELATLSGLTYDQVCACVRRNRDKFILEVKREKTGMKTTKIPLSRRSELIPKPPNTENVLVIGDVHIPYEHEGYLAFCYDTYKKYKCTHVIFTGDLLDQYNFSRFDHDPDTMNGSTELEKAQERIKDWYALFPKADVLVGNHDSRILKKAFGAGLPRRLLLSYQDFLDVPGWNFREKFIYDGVRYIHGEGGSADARARKDMISTVQGHLHPEAYVKHIQGENTRIFAMQIGCGVDSKSYAFDYAKHQKRPVIGVGVVLEYGTLPINIIL